MMVERRAKVSELWTMGLEQWEIADKIGVSEATISRDVAALEEQSSSESVEKRAAYKAHQFGVLRASDRRLAIIIAKRGENIPAADLARLTDCRLRIMERIAKLLGLDAPAKTELSGPDGGPIELVAAAQEAREHLAAKLEAINAARQEVGT